MKHGLSRLERKYDLVEISMKKISFPFAYATLFFLMALVSFCCKKNDANPISTEPSASGDGWSQTSFPSFLFLLCELMPSQQMQLVIFLPEQTAMAFIVLPMSESHGLK